jgi:hypothetical protein
MMDEWEAWNANTAFEIGLANTDGARQQRQAHEALEALRQILKGRNTK